MRVQVTVARSRAFWGAALAVLLALAAQGCSTPSASDANATPVSSSREAK